MTGDDDQLTSGYYFAVSPLMLFPDTQGDFGIYLKRQNRFILYCPPEERLTTEHLQRLHDNGVQEVFVLTAQKDQYDHYLEQNLGRMLLDETLPQTARAQVFYRASISMVSDAFKRRLPPAVVEQNYQKMMRFVGLGLQFLTKAGSLKTLSGLISHDYQTYNHCVHVFMYTASILQEQGMTEEDLVQCSMGALVHDIGKTLIPRNILNKPGKLTSSERQIIESHPVRGAGVLAQAPLTTQVINSILFHHERFNGQGYPAGLRAGEIPFAVKVVTVCDVYDALTSNRPYAKSYTPFEALSLMRDDMKGHFDPDVMKMLVMVLSGAKVV